MAEMNWPIQISSTGNQPVITIGQLQANYNRVENRANMMLTMQRSIATQPGSGLYLFSMPPGLMVDPNSVLFDDGASHNGTFVGSGRFYSVQGAGVFGVIKVKPYSQTQLVVSLMLSNATFGYWTAGFPAWNVLINASFSISVPIQGWV